jgi:hypothetical protein
VQAPLTQVCPAGQQPPLQTTPLTQVHRPANGPLLAHVSPGWQHAPLQTMPLAQQAPLRQSWPDGRHVDPQGAVPAGQVQAPF